MYFFGFLSNISSKKEEIFAAVLFYQYISEKDNDFLAIHNYSKEEALDGIKRLAEKQGPLRTLPQPLISSNTSSLSLQLGS